MAITTKQSKFKCADTNRVFQRGVFDDAGYDEPAFYFEDEFEADEYGFYFVGYECIDEGTIRIKYTYEAMSMLLKRKGYGETSVFYIDVPIDELECMIKLMNEVVVCNCS